MTQVCWLHPDDPAWLEHLAGVPHDIYHLPGYVATTAQSDGGEPWGLLIRQQDASLFVPLLVRKLPATLDTDGWRDATTPYGYPTPLVQSPDDTTTQQLLTVLKDALRECHIVSLFCRLHPLLPVSQAPFGKVGRLVQQGQTVYADLRRSLAEITSKVRKGYRYDVRKLKQNAFWAQACSWDDIPYFRSIYHQTMARIGAKSYYFFNDSYFDNLKNALGDKLFLWLVFSPEHEPIAAGLFSHYQNIVQYHLSGTDERYVSQAPNKLMLLEVMHWAKAQGAAYMHFGGGLGGREDSLFHFKAGFSKQRADFFTYRLIADAQAYDTLCTRWQEQHQAPLDETFFPAYRK